MKRYEKMFADLKTRGEGAFIPFVMLGDPDLATSEKIIDTLVESGADALELGFPFSDPVADGPVIQRAAMRALQKKVTPNDCFALLKRIRAKHNDIPVGLLVYANLVMQGSGIAGFYKNANASGVDSVLVADAPTLEVMPFVKAAQQNNVAPVMVVPPNVNAERLAQIAECTKGYTYVVTRAGVTGADKEVNLSSQKLLVQLKELNAAPAIFGFGISKPEHVKAALNEGAAGAISGSAIVAKIAENLNDQTQMLKAIAAFVSEMKEASRHVKTENA